MNKHTNGETILPTSYRTETMRSAQTNIEVSMRTDTAHEQSLLPPRAEFPFQVPTVDYTVTTTTLSGTTLMLYAAILLLGALLVVGHYFLLLSLF
jgi:hypothetical protein